MAERGLTEAEQAELKDLEARMSAAFGSDKDDVPGERPKDRMPIMPFEGIVIGLLVVIAGAVVTRIPEENVKKQAVLTLDSIMNLMMKTEMLG